VTGKPFPRLVQEVLVRPLHLDGMYVGAPDEALADAAKLLRPQRDWLTAELLSPERTMLGQFVLWWAGIGAWALRAARVQLDVQGLLDAMAPRGISSFDFGAERTLRAAIPAANGLFTARALAKMYAALAGGGQIDGVRLLTRRTLARATQPQSTPRQRMVIPFDMQSTAAWVRRSAIYASSASVEPHSPAPTAACRPVVRPGWLHNPLSSADCWTRWRFTRWPTASERR
jgi:CubicO group peptidase (beta-lactamase class C family)